MATKATCPEPGLKPGSRCGKKLYAKGLCQAHYMRAYRGPSTPGPVRPPSRPATVVLSIRVTPEIREKALANPDRVRELLARL